MGSDWRGLNWASWLATRRCRWAGVLLAALLVLGAWGALRVGLELRDWLDSDTWRVTRSMLIDQQLDGGVRYGYEVDGWPYVSERTHFFHLSAYLDDRPRRWLDINRGLTAVAVFYDPDDPQRSVLVRRVDGTVWRIPALLGLLWLLALGAVIIGGWWRSRGQCRFQDPGIR